VSGPRPVRCDRARSFKNNDTEAIVKGKFVESLDNQIQQRAREKLKYLDSAVELRDLMIPPSNQLEAFKGERAGQHSMRINRPLELGARTQ
jgi:proteic killer suppression protein